MLYTKHLKNSIEQIKKINKLNNKRFIDIQVYEDKDIYLILAVDLDGDSIHIENTLYTYQLLFYRLNKYSIPQKLTTEYFKTIEDCKNMIKKHIDDIKNNVVKNYPENNYMVRIINTNNEEITYFEASEEEIRAFNFINSDICKWLSLRRDDKNERLFNY